MQYQILTTGSHGNALWVDNHILIDAGVTRKWLSQRIDLAKVDTLFISHRHGDHCNLPLLRYFIQQGVAVYLPEGVYSHLQEEGRLNPAEYTNITRISGVTKAHWGNYTVTFLPQRHYDLTNYALMLTWENKAMLYATDLDTLGPSERGVGLYHVGPFDYLFLEGNYDAEWLRTYIEQTLSVLDDSVDYRTITSEVLNRWIRAHHKALPREVASGLFRAVQNMRHLSKQQARAYAKTHLKPDGKYYEMHRSSLFYEQPSDWDKNTLLLDHYEEEDV